MCNENFPNARARILMKNITYVGVLAALLEIDLDVMAPVIDTRVSWLTPTMQLINEIGVHWATPVIGWVTIVAGLASRRIRHVLLLPASLLAVTALGVVGLALWALPGDSALRAPAAEPTDLWFSSECSPWNTLSSSRRSSGPAKNSVPGVLTIALARTGTPLFQW